MHSRVGIVGVLLGVALLWTGAAQAETKNKYIGVDGCGKCHGKELIGDQVASWRDGPHAKAMEALKSEKALAIAKERGLTTPPSEADECVECHATAHGLKKTDLHKGEPLAISDSVQCESCHGPGSGYKSNKTMSDRDKAVAKGLQLPDENHEICTGCHNERSPTFDVAAGFDYEASKEKIAHPIPEAVKGRYLEEVRERKRKAMMGGGGGGGDDDEDDEE